MNKTIYIRDEDAGLWARARAFAGEKLSPIIVDFLRSYVAEQESKARGFQRLILRYQDEDGLRHAKAFMGQWVYSPNEPWTDGRNAYVVALTVKEAIVLVKATGPRKLGEGQIELLGASFHVYGSLEDARKAGHPKAMLENAAWTIDAIIEELDI